VSWPGIQSFWVQQPIDHPHDDTDQHPIDHTYDDADQQPIDHTYDDSLACYYDRDDCGSLRRPGRLARRLQPDVNIPDIALDFGGRSCLRLFGPHTAVPVANARETSRVCIPTRIGRSGQSTHLRYC